MTKSPKTTQQSEGQTTARSFKDKQLFLFAKDFRIFTTGMTVLAELAPERTTTAQMVFFLLAAQADLEGKPATFQEIREGAGPVIGKSLHTTYKLFFPADERNENVSSKSLGWLQPFVDRADRRRKYLHLTEAGRAVMRELILAVKGHDADETEA